MATGIEWTDETWNPLAGCSVTSEGCKRCYAMREAGGRLRSSAKFAGLTQPSKAGPVWTGEVRLWEPALDQPLYWSKPRRIFVNSMSDLFHEAVPDEWIDRIFAVMALCPQHTFQCLTKRAERMRDYMTGDAINRIISVLMSHRGEARFTWPLPNVWLVVSAEDQPRAEERIPLLLDTPAAVRGVSVEPLLGPVDLVVNVKAQWGRFPLNALSGENPSIFPYPHLDWVVVGGESGPGARPMHPDWARSLREQCLAAGVPFFFKQWGHYVQVDAETHHRDYAAAANGEGRWKFDRVVDPNGTVLPSDSMCVGRRVYMRPVGKKRAGRELDGRTWDEYPGQRDARTALGAEVR